MPPLKYAGWKGGKGASLVKTRFMRVPLTVITKVNQVELMKNTQ